MSEIQLLCQNDNSFIVENGDINANGDETKRHERTQRNDTTKNGTSPLGGESRSIYDPPDGGWGWVVTFSAFIVGVILDGISFSFGLFFKELYIYFNESRSLTSWIISVLNGTYLSIGPLASVLVSLYGCRKVAIFGAVLSSCSFFLSTWSPNVVVMILLYGLFGGAGLGLMYLPSLVIVGHYFKKRRALATGIAVCGSGVGAFVFGIFGEVLIEVYDWKGAMWIISAVCLNGVVVSAMFRPISSMDNTPVKNVTINVMEMGNGSITECCQEQAKKIPYVDWYSIFYFPLLRSPTFLLYGTSCFLCMLGFFIPLVYIPDLSEASGMTPQQSGVLIAIFGIVNTVGRVLCGWLADRTWCDEIILNSVFLIVGGVLTFFVPAYSTFTLMASYCAVYGLVAAVFTTLRSVIMADLLGLEKLNSSFGLVVLCEGLASFIGAPLAGALTDSTANYKAAFYLAGTTISLSGAICFPLRRVSNWEKWRQYTMDKAKNLI